MAIQDNGTRIQYTATAAQTIFAYPFEIFDEDDIAVEQNGTLLSKGTHYTVSGVGNDNGGNITLVTGATAGDTMTLYRNMVLERVTDYQQNGDFLAGEVNDDLDRLWAALQQNETTANIGIRPTINDSILNSSNTELADPATRGGKALGFTSTGLLDYISGTMPVGTLRQYSTMAAAKADVANTTIGDILILAERQAGKNGGGLWAVKDAATVAENEYDVVTGDGTRSFDIIPQGEIRFDQLGIFDDGGASDQKAGVQAAIDRALADELPLNGTFGTFRIDSALDKITEDFTFFGDQKGSFRIRRNYTEADATRGVLHAEAGTQSWRDIYIEAEAGTTGGAGFSLVATASTSPDFSVIENVLATGLSGTGTFAHPIYVDGSARTGSALGVRDLAIINGDFFAGTTHIGFFKSVNNTKLLGAQFFTAGGTATTVRVDGTASSPSNTFLLSSTFIADLQIDRLSKGVFNVANSINSVTNTANVTNALIIAASVTTYQTNWVRSQVFANDATTEFNSGDLLVRDSNGSATNNLEFTYNGTTGLATVGPKAGGNTEMELRTTTSGTYRGTHRINSTGSWIFLTTQTAASAANSSLFVDSADNKLKYKDSGGTTNNLY